MFSSDTAHSFIENKLSNLTNFPQNFENMIAVQ